MSGCNVILWRKSAQAFRGEVESFSAERVHRARIVVGSKAILLL